MKRCNNRIQDAETCLPELPQELDISFLGLVSLWV